MFSEFILTDGTTIIDFLALNKRGYGLGIVRYTPGRPNLKAGGIWQDSPLGSGRRLVHGVKGNVNDAIEFRIGYANHVGLIGAQQELDLLLEKAIAYWTTDWQDEPVYIKARAAGEASARYAIIHSAEFPNYPDPYDQPYAGSGRKFVLDGMILGIERGDWTGNAPGTGTDITLSNQEVTTATTDPVAIVNHSTDSALAAIARLAGDANQINDALPFTLFSTYLDEGWLHLGSDRPIGAVVFNIGSPISADSYTVNWEYSIAATTSSGGETWGTAVEEDATSGFTTPGVGIVRLKTTDSGSPAKYNMPTSGNYYWIRVHITDLVNFVSWPTQITRQVYVPSSPYVTIAAVQVPGDLNALARFDLGLRVHADHNTDIEQVLFGLRSTSRGADFNAYINPENNGAGVTMTLPSGATLTVDASVVTGSYIAWTSPDSTAWKPVVEIELDSSIAAQYYGRYRLFVRGSLASTTGAVQARSHVRYKKQTTGQTGDTKIHITDSTPFNVTTDLGYIEVPTISSVRFTDVSDTIVIGIEAKGAASARLETVILLPVDEWSAQFSGGLPTAYENYLLDIDSITYPKERMHGIIKLASNEAIVDSFEIISSQAVQVAANAEQKLWLMIVQESGANWMTATITAAINPRYHFLRGS